MTQQVLITRSQTIKVENFLPKPDKLLKKIWNNNSYFGFIHGSFAYKKCIPKATYSDTRVFNEKNEFIESRFKLELQNPDVDSIVCVENIGDFLKSLRSVPKPKNYFLTINVISLETFSREVEKKTPVALKTILAFRPLIRFGKQTDILEKLELTAKSNISDIDIQFQKEYDLRKKLYRENINRNIKYFKLTREEYEEKFPLLLRSFENNLEAAFPQNREKIVLPHPMDLKKKLIISAGGVEKLFKLI
jgi:hypothetical protein